MNSRLLAYIQLHFAVLLFGLTAILGDLISISAISLVWWRVLITSISLLFFVNVVKLFQQLNRKMLLIYTGIGVIVGIHWITFYGAIKLGNASIALAAMATTTLFTSIIEPILTEKKFEPSELMISILIIPLMVIMTQNLDFSLIIGFLVGLLSALLAATFATLNKKYVNDANPYQITFLEMFSAFAFISLILPFTVGENMPLMPQPSDWKYLITLSLLCTTLAYLISLTALKHVSAFEANLVVNLEPVYGILLAVLILGEHKEMSTLFYLSLAGIMCIVLLHPLIKKKFQKQ